MKNRYLNRLYLLINLLFGLMFTTVSWGEERGENWQPVRSFLAELVEYNQHQPSLQRKMLIQIGREGVRLTEIDSNTGQSVFIQIQNFRTQQVWIVRPDLLYYSELPAVKEVDESQDDVDFSQGVLSSESCFGMDKRKQREYGLKGGLLTVWSCIPKSGEPYTQHYSSLLGVVIRQEKTNGHIFELRNIVLDPPEKNIFTPSKLWRELSVEEFFMGVPMLPLYRE